MRLKGSDCSQTFPGPRNVAKKSPSPPKIADLILQRIQQAFVRGAGHVYSVVTAPADTVANDAGPPGVIGTKGNAAVVGAGNLILLDKNCAAAFADKNRRASIRVRMGVQHAIIRYRRKIGLEKRGEGVIVAAPIVCHHDIEGLSDARHRGEQYPHVLIPDENIGVDVGQAQPLVRVHGTHAADA